MVDNKTAQQQQQHAQDQQQQPRFRVPFGEGIRRRRHALNLTAAELAKMVGVVESTITRMEQRAGPPTSHVLVKRIAAVFGVSTEELIKGSISADLLTYSDPVAALAQEARARPTAARPYVSLPHGSQVLVEGEAEGLVASLMADAIALEAISPEDLAALVRVSGAMRLAAEHSLEHPPLLAPAPTNNSSNRKERKRVRHTSTRKQQQEQQQQG